MSLGSGTKVVRSVVVVDDMMMNCMILEAMCKSFGVETVMSFKSGASALAYLGSCTAADLPDAILSDLAMPEMDGAELSRAVNGMWPAIPLVAITAEYEPDRKYDLSLFTAVLSKRFYADQLKTVLENLPAR